MHTYLSLSASSRPDGQMLTCCLAIGMHTDTSSRHVVSVCFFCVFVVVVVVTVAAAVLAVIDVFDVFAVVVGC